MNIDEKAKEVCRVVYGTGVCPEMDAIAAALRDAYNAAIEDAAKKFDGSPTISIMAKAIRELKKEGA